VLVRGDPELGAVLRGLRASRLLSQTQVASRVCCDASLVSMVESGKRVLQPDLARRLDHLYGTGTMISALAGSLAYSRSSGCATLEGGGDVVLVELPLRGVTVPVSRRAVLAALGMGVTATTVPGLDEASATVVADEEFLAQTTQSLAALRAAGRVLPPTRVLDPLIGQVALLDVVRHRAPRPLRRAFIRLQAQHAQYLSWMVQEAGDPTGATYWIDRAQHWAAASGWPAMTVYAHTRRSELASTCAGDGRAAIEHATHAIRTPGAPTWVRAFAAKQIAYGHALTGNPDACRRALDQTARLMERSAAQDEEPDPIVGGMSIDVPVLLGQFQGTCDLYLGGWEQAIHFLGSSHAAHRAAAGSGSRHHGITGARLARAHAQAGDPEQACALALAALSTGQALDSLSTRIELRRTLRPLDRWPGRDDVAEVRHQITALA
jgi:Helix-turn-helix domain